MNGTIEAQEDHPKNVFNPKILTQFSVSAPQSFTFNNKKCELWFEVFLLWKEQHKMTESQQINCVDFLRRHYSSMLIHILGSTNLFVEKELSYGTNLFRSYFEWVFGIFWDGIFRNFWVKSFDHFLDIFGPIFQSLRQIFGASQVCEYYF